MKNCNEGIKKYFEIDPNTPPKTTKDTTYLERKKNWDMRITKAKEEGKKQSLPLARVYNHVNDFLDKIKDNSCEIKNTTPRIIELDKNNQALILDNGLIVIGSNNWDLPKWDNKKREYVKWDPKFNIIKNEFNLRYPNDIIWLKFTKKHHLGVVAKSFDINFNMDNCSGKLIKSINEEWDSTFVLIFPLTKELLVKYNKDSIERAVGNYLIDNGVPIIDYFSHNYE